MTKDILIDYQEALRRFCNRSDFLLIALETWFENEHESFDLLQQSIIFNDQKGMMNYAHSIKGSASNIAALKVTTIADKITSLYKEKKWEEGSSLFPDLKTAFDETLLEIQHYINRK